MHIDQDGTLVRLDSDRAGETAAVLRFRSSCDLGDAVVVPSSWPGVERLEFVDRVVPGFRADRHHLFEGGCVTWRFDFDDGVSATESVAIDDALILVRRSELNEGIRETFIDEEL